MEKITSGQFNCISQSLVNTVTSTDARVYMIQLNFQMLTNLRAQQSVFSDSHVGGSELGFFSPGEFSCTAAIEKQNSIK